MRPSALVLVSLIASAASAQDDDNYTRIVHEQEELRAKQMRQFDKAQDRVFDPYAVRKSADPLPAGASDDAPARPAAKPAAASAASSFPWWIAVPGALIVGYVFLTRRRALR